MPAGRESVMMGRVNAAIPSCRRRSTRRLAARLVTAVLVTSMSACALSTTSRTSTEDGTSAGPTDSARQAQDDRYRLSKTCPKSDTMFPVSADIVNKVVASTHLPAWRAADIGASAKLSDNRLAWVFGDTVRDQAHDPSIVANSILISSGLCITQVLPKDDGPVIPDVSDKVVHWPMSVARVDPRKVDMPGADQSTGDLLVVLAGRIRRGDQNAFDFTYLGSSAAIFTVQPGRAPQLLGIQRITPDSTSPTQINWGSASFVEGQWAYVYGSRTTGEKHTYGRELYVARLPVAQALDRTKWRFWDGSSWQADRSKAKAVLPASEGVSQTLSVSRTHGRYVIVSKKGGDLGDFVYTWSSATPVGPWKGRAGVKAPFGLDQGDLKYAPLGHPEIPMQSGKLLVSVSRNTTDLNKLLTEPDKVGRPVFAEVDVPDI